MEPLVDPAQALVLVDHLESVDDAIVLGHQVLGLGLAVVTLIGAVLLWKRVLMRSSGCSTPEM